jgi:hypothetical protein
MEFRDRAECGNANGAAQGVGEHVVARHDNAFAPNRRSVGSSRQSRGGLMLSIYVVSEEQYLDVSPTALLIGATGLVALFVLCLVADKAIGWLRSRQ